MRSAVLIFLFTAGAAAAQSGEPLRDCPDCPEMVQTPIGLVIGKHPITRGEYRVFAEETGLEARGCSLRIATRRNLSEEADWSAPGFAQEDDHPVVCVSWVEATAYADWLSERTGRFYRLPTFEESAEAAAAGTTTRFWWGDDFAEVCAHANAADASFRAAYPDDPRPILSCQDGHAYTSPVGAFPANPWGLHDVTGNVWTWTNSCLGGDCANAVFRGGGWDTPAAKFFASDGSFGDRILLRNDVIGFRLLRDAE